MPDIRVILVAPKFEGNIGAIARSMANFDAKELYLVHPCAIGDDAYRRAKHGSDILDHAVTVDSIAEAVEGCFLIVGTTGIVTNGERNHVRVPISVRQLAERAKNYTEKIAILFGREDIGLLQDELTRCDVLVHIPSSEEYPVLNISHAATIVLYELFGTDIERPEPADEIEKERIFNFFDELLDNIEYPEHRREYTSVMFKRMIGRSVPSKTEYYTIMGVIGDANKLLTEKRKFHQK